jgi:hypothetical protein
MSPTPLVLTLPAGRRRFFVIRGILSALNIRTLSWMPVAMSIQFWRESQPMNAQATYLKNLKRSRPSRYQTLEQDGLLNDAAEQAEKGYLEAVQQYQASGLSQAEAQELAAMDWLEPVSEEEERLEAVRLRQIEEEEEGLQAQKLVALEQGYDPKKKSRQEWVLPDGRKVVRTGKVEMVYPPATSESTPQPLDKAASNQSTATT